jgi:uracil-DNA glycosylase
MTGTPSSPLVRLLDWYIAMGVDEVIETEPQDRFAERASTAAVSQPSSPAGPSPREPTQPAQGPALLAPAAAVSSARELAFAARSLAELETAVRAFNGCALKRTATNTVFADGSPDAPLMVIGEAPGADEDRIGRPFVGRAGQLLDRMLAAIQLDRTKAYITNVLFWRPPGNRKPTNDEIAACLPFVWRHIAIKRPRVLLLAGGTSASTLLGRSEGIMRLRGRWVDLTVPDIERPVATLATFHPSFLLRAPARKAEAWADLLSLKARLETAE